MAQVDKQVFTSSCGFIPKRKMTLSAAAWSDPNSESQRRNKVPTFTSRVSIPILAMLLLSSHADTIRLKDGTSGQVTVVDTLGCSVLIERKKHRVSISRADIDFLVIGRDTVRLSSIHCDSTYVRGDGLLLSERDKCYQLVQNVAVGDPKMDTIAIAYLMSSFPGGADSQFSDSLLALLADELVVSHDVRRMTESELLQAIEENNPVPAIVFYPVGLSIRRIQKMEKTNKRLGLIPEPKLRYIKKEIPKTYATVNCTYFLLDLNAQARTKVIEYKDTSAVFVIGEARGGRNEQEFEKAVMKSIANLSSQIVDYFR